MLNSMSRRFFWVALYAVAMALLEIGDWHEYGSDCHPDVVGFYCRDDGGYFAGPAEYTLIG